MKKGKQGVNLVNASHTRSRRDLDYYPTPPSGTHGLMQHLRLKAGTVVLEPCCGEGAMSKVMSQYGLSVISQDIEDYGFGSVCDFMQSDLHVDWVITNPPFFCIEDIILKAKQCASQGVAMLVKSQFWHASKRLQLFRAFKPAEILPLTWRLNFNTNAGKSPTMETMWVVWRVGYEGPTHYLPMVKPSTLEDIL